MMGESRKDSLDGSSIKPVSSLRSHFEQMSSVKTNNGVQTPVSPYSGPISIGTHIKSTRLNVSTPSRPLNQNIEEKCSLQSNNSRNTNQGNDEVLNYSSSATKNLAISPTTFSLRSLPSPSPAVNKIPYSSPPMSNMVSLKLQEAPSKNSELSDSEIPAVQTASSTIRPKTPQKLRRPGRSGTSHPPSPPPPRRFNELRFPPINRPERPKITSKPISLAIRTQKSILEPESPGLSDNEVSPFITPPSASGPANEFPSPSSLRFQIPELSESNSETKSIEHRNFLTVNENENEIRLHLDQISPQFTGNQKPALPVRSSMQADSMNVRSTKNYFQNSRPTTTSLEPKPKNSPSLVKQPYLAHRSTQSSIAAVQNLDKLPVSYRNISKLAQNKLSDRKIRSKESLNITQEQFPDPSLSNRRPPYLKEGARDISTKYETRIMDICGEYVCTSGHLTRVWNLNNGEIVASFAHTEGVKITSIAFKPAADLNNEGLQIWLGNNIGDILEVDITTKTLVETKANAHNRREVVRMHRHHRDMWTLDNGGTLHLWAADAQGSLSLKNYAQSYRLPKGHTFSMVAGNELWLATGKNIRVFMPTVDASIPFEVLQNPLNQPYTGDITSGTTNSAQPEKLFFGHADGKVSVYSKVDYTCLNIVSISVYKITALASTAGNLWAGFSTGVIFIYDVEASPWIVKKDWSAHQGPIIKLISDPSSCWSLKRAQVVTLGQDNMLRIWDGLLEDDYIENEMHLQKANFCESKDITALIMTWNAGASTPFSLQQHDEDSTIFRNLILSSGCPDILVFGFQELVDLEDKKAVTKSFFKSKKKYSSVQEHMSHQYRDWRDFLTRCLDDYMPRDELYHLLHTTSLVGLFTCVFVRAPLIDRIRSLTSAQVKRGLGGLHGNKGAIIVRFVVDDTSMCFVNCHLAAGQSGTRDRNADITAILEASILPSENDYNIRLDSFIGGGDGTMILDHEICIVNGDLNYRIDTMSRETVINAVKTKNIKKLLERDQLLASKKKNPWFKLRAFQESPITFAPTYKYDVGTDKYDTSEKKRSPAWCDRILYRGEGFIEQLDYRRHEVRVSDHRPVTGTFQIRVKSILPKKRDIMWDEVQKKKLRRKEALINEAIKEYLTNIVGYDTELSHAMVQKNRAR
ncbi:putative inositol polyphosphate 5-phosphatase C9G1.10c [Erysiphe neolycopersici]|uniref:Putative inositol polyphosphate 5-phosphatase C9G1.10c n=1 Tax=Erysiphe neolycopersici TaxID=212602 RepID=A0A420HNE3_9PEZI|nr:putative inositol polyphosphate 5-phosphatase C9G1.10c [Erysiphe neolycopersici]